MVRAQQHAAVRFCRAPKPGCNSTPSYVSAERRSRQGKTARRRALLQSAAAGRAKQHAAVRFCRAPEQVGLNSTPPCASTERRGSQGKTARRLALALLHRPSTATAARGPQPQPQADRRRSALLQSAAAARAKQHAAVRFCRAPEQAGQNSTPPCASAERRSRQGKTARRRALLQSAVAASAKQHAAVRFCRDRAPPHQPGGHSHSRRQTGAPSVLHAAAAIAFKQQRLLSTFARGGPRSNFNSKRGASFCGQSNSMRGASFCLCNVKRGGVALILR
jgi:hypothetical protein